MCVCRSYNYMYYYINMQHHENAPVCEYLPVCIASHTQMVVESREIKDMSNSQDHDTGLICRGQDKGIRLQHLKCVAS